MIRVDVRAKDYDGVPVLRDVRFDVARGETVALLGPSGIGKSTLLRLIAGIDTDFEGHVEAPEAMAIVFQEPTLLLWRSVLDNILLVHPRLPRDEALATLGKVGLRGKETQFPTQLSLGQQRRLSLARAFAGKPELLIMDEPFVSLDAAMADEMLGLAEALIAETRPATIFVTHAEPEAARLATRHLVLGGRPATLQP
ncbi:ABC transporter ATP-binding protein [Oceaniglobus roseus]|uniref:ABC transporter ATP-binding protein n=1 Tax=Oceaniglobus roseus TaxID=1737570 RepID=UPI000C7F6880|nr:ABC transporter ATP-binding protein [Kandeliimicrobium roseum]